VGNYKSKSFKISIFVSVLLIAFTLALGIYVGLNSKEDIKEEVVKRLKEIEATPQFIFLNNFGVSLATLIPFFGTPFHLFVQYNTGFGIGAIADLQNVHPLLLIFFSLPIFLLEYISYTLVLAEGLNLSYLILKKKDALVRIKKYLWRTLILVALLLGIGAIIEAQLISFLR